jgi:putative tryptophan/tyrosine transport system substrate-binding protein
MNGEELDRISGAVEQPTRFQLSVNLKIAKHLGREIPATVLVRADRIIE